MNHQRLQLIAFLILFACVGAVVALMWWPFLNLLALAGIMAVLFWPVYQRFVRAFKNQPMAALACIFIVLFIVMVPLYFMGQLLFNEVVGLYNQLRDTSAQTGAAQIINHLPPQFKELGQSFINDLGSKFSQVAGGAFQSLGAVLSNVAGFVLSFFLVFFTFYYLLRDGEKIKKYMGAILPLSEKHENILVEKISSAVNGVVKGSFLVALIQGVVGTAGYLIFGVPNPLLWGAFTVLAALVPTVGTSLAIIPAVLYLLATGHTGAAVGMAVWGALAVGMVDNLAGPKLVGSQTQIHPLLILFGILGGIKFFGFFGFLLGPIIMAVFVTLVDIYREDLKEYMER